MTTRELDTASLPYKCADPSRYSIRVGQTPLLRGADFGFYDQKRWSAGCGKDKLPRRNPASSSPVSS